MKPLVAFLALTLVSIVQPPTVFAQTELELSRTSLAGIGRLAVSVQLEGSAEISADSTLDVRGLGQAVRRGLDDARIPVIPPDQELPDSPRLWIHINALDAGQGIIPFNIEAQVQQNAELTRNGFTAPMVTWETSVVGVVSMDRLVVIREALLELLDEFIDDYHTTNGDADTRLPESIR